MLNEYCFIIRLGGNKIYSLYLHENSMSNEFSKWIQRIRRRESFIENEFLDRFEQVRGRRLRVTGCQQWWANKRCSLCIPEELETWLTFHYTKIKYRPERATAANATTATIAAEEVVVVVVAAATFPTDLFPAPSTLNARACGRANTCVHTRCY